MANDDVLSANGFVDFYGFQAAAGFWFSGWIAAPEAQMDKLRGLPSSCQAFFETGQISGELTCAVFTRGDLSGSGIGIVGFTKIFGKLLGRLVSISLSIGDRAFGMVPATSSAQLRDTELASRITSTLALASTSRQRAELFAIASRRSFAGVDTIASLSTPVHLGIDEFIRCSPTGAVIIGWYLANPGTVRSMRICSGWSSAEVPFANRVRIERSDVFENLKDKVASPDPQCGFLAYVPDFVPEDASTHLEVELRSGEVGYKALPASRLEGIAAMRRILEPFDLQYKQVRPAFENVIGPSIFKLNAARLIVRPNLIMHAFGKRFSEPRYSVVIAVYGRFDYMEYQAALLSACDGLSETEFIYVIDDPRIARDVERLAESLSARFDISFQVLILDHNVGFAPANNIGLDQARGDFVCFLNSDVFPGSRDWLSRLRSSLEENPDIGAVGPMLLYEDGSVQHEGMTFEAVPWAGDMHFPMHKRKGKRPSRTDEDLVRVEAITGACMFFRRSVILQLRGFDEAYAIGDFEDADLCHRLRKIGFACAVNHRVHLYHLERKSQAAPGQRWRMNLTLYNAWIHQNRWIKGAPEEHEPSGRQSPDVERIF
jgi:GT2 family glycosyltransferase